MKPQILSPIRSCLLSTLILVWGAPWGRAAWESRDGVLAWRQGTNVVWQFNYGPRLGKPHFHPLSVNGGPALTSAAPKDHPWHYGLWFSWKYINGGYGGFGLRLAPDPLVAHLVTESGPVTQFTEYRARPEAGALGCNLTRDGKSVGAIALLSDSANVADHSPWYCALTPSMRFLCSAILAPKPLKLGPGKEMSLRYRILVRQSAWTPGELKTQFQEWMHAKSNQ